MWAVQDALGYDATEPTVKCQVCARGMCRVGVTT